MIPVRILTVFSVQISNGFDMKLLGSNRLNNHMFIAFALSYNFFFPLDYEIPMTGYKLEGGKIKIYSAYVPLHCTM
jgi:hypothetical protein